MRALLERVGRLQRLAVFEAAARRGTFTAAAAELGMTQPGVTRHIRALEAGLGLVLFERTANRAVLSAVGERLYASVAQGFGTIESGLQRIDGDPAVFVLAANPGIAQRWLVPYLDGLQGAVGNLDLRLWLFDRNAELAGGRFDAAIHAGSGHWPDSDSVLLFPEIVVPVATPELASRLGLDGNTPPDDLLGQELLHLDETDRPWMSWAGWFAHHGLALEPRHTQVSYNNYALVLQQAIAGRGIALGWRYLVDEFLEQELLVTVGPAVNNRGSGYYLIWPAGNGDEAVRRLATWLERLIGRTQRSGTTDDDRDEHATRDPR